MIDLVLYVSVGVYNIIINVHTNDGIDEASQEDFEAEINSLERSIDINNIIAIIAYFIMMMRFFSYFRLINAFSSLVGIIMIIIRKLALFLFIIAYFFFTFLLLARYFDHEKKFDETIFFMYAWMILGGVDGSHLKQFQYSWLIIVIGTIFMSIILMNIIIAYLSNVFSRLEEEHTINMIKEKASMILDLELIVYFFKYVLTGKKNKMGNKKDYQDQEHKRLVSKDSQEVNKSK